MEYTLMGGGKIEATNKKELVEKLREISFTPGESLQDFMDIVSKNCYIYNRYVVRCDDYEEFINDLIKHGYLK